jgi:hypothetical protein
MKIGIQKSSQAEALPRCSLKKRPVGALAFFGAVFEGSFSIVFMARPGVLVTLPAQSNNIFGSLKRTSNKYLTR